MSELIVNQSISAVEENMLQFFETHDPKFVNEDATFRMMSTGESYSGRADIGAMLHYFYHIAFEARLENPRYMVSQDRAFVEGHFVGKHIGEFAGIPATNRDVRVPLCVSYDLKDDKIQQARVYLLSDVLMQQLNG